MSWREALINPFMSTFSPYSEVEKIDITNAAPVLAAPQSSAERDPPVMSDYADPAAFVRGFDPDAFFTDIAVPGGDDPPPLFLQPQRGPEDAEADLRALIREAQERLARSAA